MTYSNPYASTSSPTNFIAFSGMGMRKGGRAMLMPSNYQGDGSTLNLDFTTGVLDPRLTFSRASAATFVNSSGYVVWAEANLVLNSTMLVGTSFTPVTSGGGTVTINNDNTVTFASTAGRATWLQSIASLQVGLSVTFSIEVTALTNTNIRVSDLFQAGTGFSSQVYNYTDSSGNTTAGIGAFTTLPGIGLYTVNAVITATPGNVIFGTDCNGVARTGSVTITRPQFQYGTRVSSRVYFANSSTAAAYHAPRFDYSPTNIGEPRGLLIEGQTANVVTNSNAIGNAGGLTRTYPTGVISPDGTENAQRFTKTDVTTPRYIYPTTLFTVAASTAYTASIWIKYDGYAFTTQIQSDSAVDWGGSWTASFVIASGGITVGSRTGICSASTVTPYPNGWYRCTATITTGAAPTGANPRFLIDVVGTTGVSVLVYGLQLEAGSGASSYVPTGASGVTRVSDSCTVSGTNFSSWFTQGEGTLYAYSDVVKSNGRNLVARIENAAATNYIEMGLNAVGYTTEAVAYAGGAFTSLGSAYTPVINVPYKSAYTWSSGRLNLGANGTTPTAVSATLVTDLIRIGIGGAFNVTDVWVRNGHIRQLKYYPMVMTNAQLEALTAP